MSPIRAVARCRVDLGGGTLDIWPLGLLHAGACTVNVAIDVRARVELAIGGDAYTVRQNGEETTANSLEALAREPSAALVARMLSPFDPGPCTVTLASESPRGAGLGASSALGVALLAAAELGREGRLTLEPLARARLARDLEARLMGLPTGLQDHLPAQLGGALAIAHEPGGERVRRLDVDLEQLAERLIVAYTGQSHFSAGANWSVVRGRLDGDPDRIARLERIAAAARRMAPALESAAWEELGDAVREEWEARRGLALEVSTPRIEALLDGARAAGAWGGKACGAGGGGCVLALAPPAARARVEGAWRAAGAEILDARPTLAGLEVG